MILKLIAALSLALACCAYAAAQVQESNLPVINVAGEAEVRVVPDEVLLMLGVETSAKTMEDSRAQNDERVKRVIAVAREFGVEPQNIQTDYITVDPWYRDNSNRPESLEYRVRKTIVVTLKQTAKFEGLLSKALESGVTHVHGIQFRTTELLKYRNQARSLAIQAAREKAVALASELGQKIGRAQRIVDYGGGWYSPYGMWWGERWGGGGMSQISVEGGGNTASTSGTIALGQITVRANVNVTFLLE